MNARRIGILSSLLVMASVIPAGAQSEAESERRPTRTQRTYDRRVQMHEVNLGSVPDEEKPQLDLGPRASGRSISFGTEQPPMDVSVDPYLPAPPPPKEKKSKNWILPPSDDVLSAEEESTESGWGWLADEMMEQQKEEADEEEETRERSREWNTDAETQLSPEALAEIEAYGAAVIGPVDDVEGFEDEEEDDLFVGVFEDDRVSANPDRRRETEDAYYDNLTRADYEYTSTEYSEAAGTAFSDSALPRTAGLLSEMTSPMKTEMSSWRQELTKGSGLASMGVERSSFRKEASALTRPAPTSFRSAGHFGLSSTPGSMNMPSTIGSGGAAGGGIPSRSSGSGRGSFGPVSPTQPAAPVSAIGGLKADGRRRIYTVGSD